MSVDERGPLGAPPTVILKTYSCRLPQSPFSPLWEHLHPVEINVLERDLEGKRRSDPPSTPWAVVTWVTDVGPSELGRTPVLVAGDSPGSRDLFCEKMAPLEKAKTWVRPQGKALSLSDRCGPWRGPRRGCVYSSQPE